MNALRHQNTNGTIEIVNAHTPNDMVIEDTSRVMVINVGTKIILQLVHIIHVPHVSVEN